MRLIAKSLLPVLLVTTWAISVAGQTAPELDQLGRWVNGVSEPWWFPESMPKNEIAAAQLKWAEIAKENQLAKASNTVAGSYFTGSDTHGSYLRWSPKNGFVLLDIDKCQAMVMSFSYGSVISSANLLRLLPEKSISSSTKHSHRKQEPPSFVPVSWMGSLDLVPQNRMAEYFDYSAGLGEYNRPFWSIIEGSPFFSKFSDEESTTAEPSTEPVEKTWAAPKAPSRYERLIKQPVNGTIVGLGKSYIRRDQSNEWWDKLITPVTLKLSGGPARHKMNLYVKASDDSIEITRVAGRSASGIIVRSTRKRPCVKIDENDDCSDPDDPAIQVGWTASTFRF